MKAAVLGCSWRWRWPSGNCSSVIRVLLRLRAVSAARSKHVRQVSIADANKSFPWYAIMALWWRTGNLPRMHVPRMFANRMRSCSLRMLAMTNWPEQAELARSARPTQCKTTHSASKCPIQTHSSASTPLRWRLGPPMLWPRVRFEARIEPCLLKYIHNMIGHHARLRRLLVERCTHC